MLSGELATYLTGRTVEFEVAPFSFGEFREATGECWGRLSSGDLFDKYLECGGLPFLTQIRFQHQASQTYFDDLYWAILSKDVMRRLKIRDVDMLDRIVLVGDLWGEDIDQVLENVVCREFVRRGWKVTVGRVREKEVDFVCQKPGRRRYVQVSYLMPTAETREREFSALESIPDQYEKIVLSLDRFDFSRNGVCHAYLPDYLAAGCPD